MQASDDNGCPSEHSHESARQIGLETAHLQDLTLWSNHYSRAAEHDHATVHSWIADPGRHQVSD